MRLVLVLSILGCIAPSSAAGDSSSSNSSSSSSSSSSSGWSSAVAAEFETRRDEATTARRAAAKPPPRFPLAADTVGTAELHAAVDSLLSGRMTMGSQVQRFEEKLAALGDS